MSMVLQVGLLALGFWMLIKGADWFVDGASKLAVRFGIPQLVIGLTIVAMGTSLPEASVSVTASLAGKNELAISNVIGSNIFNILMVLGMAAAISPMAFLTENIIDIMILIVFSVIVWIMAWTKKELDRKEGILMVLLYAAYVVYICIR